LPVGILGLQKAFLIYSKQVNLITVSHFHQWTQTTVL
jgi:hypothetical protein